MSGIKICEHIGKTAVLALLKEVKATPKPGLVDTLNSGAHSDMDFSTFLDSTAAIAPYMEEFAVVGYTWERVDETSLSTLRPLGIECEKAMFSATNGVNTHKGAIFSLGILTACAAYDYKQHGEFSSEKICDYAGVVSLSAMADFKGVGDNPTKGEKLFKEQNITGIRGEAASGYSTVKKYPLPVLREFLSDDYNENEILLQALLTLMANTEDTNILSRRGEKGLELCKTLAKKALSLGGAFSVEGGEFLHKMNEIFVAENISPGGAADLLAIAIFLHELEKSNVGYPLCD